MNRHDNAAIATEVAKSRDERARGRLPSKLTPEPKRRATASMANITGM